MSTALVHDIEGARERFLKLFAGIDPQAAERPIGPERWSPLQYLEHLVLAEEATVWRMFKAVEESRSGRRGEVSETPQARIEEIVERTWAPQEKAPPLALPKLGGSLAYWKERLRRNSALVAAFATLVDPSEMDRVAYSHPISGPFTMRQAFEFIRFHLDRHRGHLEEAGLGRAHREV